HHDAPVAGSVVLGGCGPDDGGTGVNASRAEISRFLWTLERAALAARWAHASAPPGVAIPARDSVLEEHQVSCPARARMTNPRPEFPVAPGVSSYELVASFVVDSAGRPEPSTLRTLPGSDPRFVASFEETLPIWRYLAGRRAGHRVRQRVHVAVPFRRWNAVTPSATAAVPVAPAGDGSDRVAIGPLRGESWSGAATEAREYVFDLIDARKAAAWADSVTPYLRPDGRLPRGCYDGTCSFAVGEAEGAGIMLAVDARREGGVKYHLVLVGCNGGLGAGYDVTGDEARSLVGSVRAAARVAAARPHRAPRVGAPRHAHEVACPAYDLVKAKSSPQAWEFQGWKSGEMVVARFTVDTAGKVDPRSVRTLPGPSRAAVDSLGYLLRTVRFQPAVFGGRKVPQIVHWAIPIDVTPGDPQSPNPDLDMLADADYGWLGGPLRSADGYPVAGARVTLTRSVGPRDRLPLPYEATSNEQGYYVIPAVLPGEYRLEIRAPGYPPLMPRLVTVNAEYHTQLELVLER
ncbi:MAG TPA: carboxypeptidase-like regulatory domain-containing protein, partial [Gemmatimonadaceae bacterium]|nr:carboxypeptidase-like regulatory domain-containing protein [Gemmatimonadaceae bacterium]